MGFIQNFSLLAKTPERKIVLDLIEAALSSIQPDHVLKNHFTLSDNILTIQEQTFNLPSFNRIFLLGFGKGSAGISKIIENNLKELLTNGYVIDTTVQRFSKINFTLGTHPLPSRQNYDFTLRSIENLGNLTSKDLVLIVICGGGSAMLVSPYDTSLDNKIAINKALLQSGATIFEMNTVRKHLSKVKGGMLAKLLYPAVVASLIFSDVPGNDLSTIASGPTVMDQTSVNDAVEIVVKYNILDKVPIEKNSFTETPKEDKYFKSVHNILVLSNLTALQAMEKKATELGYKPRIFTNKFQGEARVSGKTLIDETNTNEILLVGGETTVKVIGKGKGGRNQEVVLGSLQFLDDKTTITSFDSDGWDFETLDGAIADLKTIEKAKELNLSANDYLDNNDALTFFIKTGDGIETGRLPSNVSDLMIVFKK